MSVAIVTGSGGLIGSASVRFLAEKGFEVIGLDNDLRAYFFGPDAGTGWNVARLQRDFPSYRHQIADIRDAGAVDAIFARYGKAVRLIIHTAAQPSHDWAAKEPQTDFSVNALGTLNLLEALRRFCPDAVFIFTSTNKVYGDLVNSLAYRELETRYELAQSEPFAEHGVDEGMSIDQSRHSLFGVSKTAADLLVQEYGRYFGLKTGTFRGGCLTGPDHSAAMLHGFLAYLMRCAVSGQPYTVFGYQGKQVRDNIHAFDLVSAFWEFYRAPRPGEVYNIGGSRHSNISMLEAIAVCERLTGREMRISFSGQARLGDHKWWISDVRKFQSHYPDWSYRYGLEEIMREMYEGIAGRISG